MRTRLGVLSTRRGLAERRAPDASWRVRRALIWRVVSAGSSSHSNSFAAGEPRLTSVSRPPRAAPAAFARPLQHRYPRKIAMFGSIAKSLFGSSNDRYVASLRKIVDKINAFEPQMEALHDAALQAQKIGRAHV